MLFLSRGATVLADLLIFLAGTILRRWHQ